jgi:ribosomal protein S28E/S33
MTTGIASMWQKNDANIYCNIVSAGFRNLLPAGARVTITHVKVKFNYDGGTSQTIERNVNIPPQGSDEVLLSECTDKCVKTIVGTVTVLDQQGPKPKEVVLEKTRFAEGNTCLLVGIFPLGANPVVDSDALQSFRASGDTSIFLALE